MERERVLAGFRAEAAELAARMAELTEAEFDRPTPCEPWTVRELLVHVCNAVDRVEAWLARPEPEAVDTDAVRYYRPDQRFAPESNAARVADAERGAADFAGGAAVAAHFDAVWRATYDLVTAQPDGRRIGTRWGDGMLLTEFMVTRVAEVVLHGLDLAIGLGRAPWTTDEGGDVVETLLLTAGGADVVRDLDWTRPVFLAKATGRIPMTEEETEMVRERGVRWITLG